MIAQAEHSPAASVLISWDETLLDQRRRSFLRNWPVCREANWPVAAWRSFGALILVGSEDEAAQRRR